MCAGWPHISSIGVEDAAGDAITAAVANDAAAAVIARAEGGLPLTVADIDAELVAAGATALTGLTSGASTGTLSDVLSILSGAKYQLPAGSEVEDGGNVYNATVLGFFASSPQLKQILATGAFNVSNGSGDLFNFKTP